MSLQQVYTRSSLPFSRLKQSGGHLCPGALIGPHARERERERERASEPRPNNMLEGVRLERGVWGLPTPHPRSKAKQRERERGFP